MGREVLVAQKILVHFKGILAMEKVRDLHQEQTAIIGIHQIPNALQLEFQILIVHLLIVLERLLEDKNPFIKEIHLDNNNEHLQALLPIESLVISQ